MSESGKVVVTKSKLDGLANAINDKAKSPGPKTIAQLTQTVNDMNTDPPVTSVNGKTGAVTLGKSDVGLGNVDNVRQYSATNPPPYPVTSVNGQTGEVNLVASEVGAVPTSRTVNGKALSANITLTASDVGAATMTQVNSAIQNAIGNAIGGSY